MVPSSLEIFSESLQKLVRKFDAEKHHYLSNAYSEAQARMDFIAPLFKALGWDVENEAGLPHHEREVIVEEGETDTEGRPDYSFLFSSRRRHTIFDCDWSSDVCSSD